MFKRGLIACVLLFLAGCASYTTETQEMRYAFQDGDYKAALEKLEKSGLKEQTRNRLLYRMEKAMILDRMGERDKSRRLLIEADKIVDELFTTSVSKTAATFVVNEAQSDYEGEDYEKIAIHTIAALSFIEDGKLSEAAVEARRINAQLEQINKAYGDSPNRYNEDAFARYLSGLIYEARDEIDNAIIDYAKAVQAYETSFKRFVRGDTPEQLVIALTKLYIKRGRNDRLAALSKSYPAATKLAKEELEKEKETGQIVVIHELGEISAKSTQEYLIPFGNQAVRLSFPTIYDDSSPRGQTGLQIGTKEIASENFADMDAIASTTLDDRRGRLIAKQGARLLAKGQITYQAERNFGPLAGLAANALTAATETADTRGWTSLPDWFNVSRAWLKPGKYNVTIKSAGKVAKITSVDIKRDEITILRVHGG